MANFDARIRKSYIDLDGLVLDCRHSDLADDGSLWVNRAPPARSLDRGTHGGSDNASNLFDPNKSWRADQLVGKVAYNITDSSCGVVTSNTEHEVVAALSGGAGNDWDASDSYAITTPRFGNPHQDEVSKRPTVSVVGGYKQAVFSRAAESNFKIPLDYAFPATMWTVAFEFVKGASTSFSQVVLGFLKFEIYRRDWAGDHGWWYSGGSLQTASGDMPDGVWLFQSYSDSVMKAYQDGTVRFSGSILPEVIAAGDPCGHIGDCLGGSKACDMTLRHMQIWNRKVSPLEVDFAFQSVNPEFDHAADDRASCSLEAWTDDTSTIPRINPTLAASHKFVLAQKPAAGRYRVQVVAMVNGHVLPDSELGGDLFDLTPIELPCSSNPPVYQDTGWSSVFDIAVDDEGHYTYLLSRQNGGSVIVHFDVEDV